MKPGREMGAMLNELLEYVIDDPSKNDKEQLCNYVRIKMFISAAEKEAAEKEAAQKEAEQKEPETKE